MKHLFFKVLSRIYHKMYLPCAFLTVKITYKNHSLIQNKIVVDNFAGKGYGDNPKYIVNSLLKKRSDLDIVWLVSDMKTEVPKAVRKVKYYTPQALKELMTSKIWIDNIKNAFKPNKRDDQFYLQTWHGGLAVKAIERQVEENLDPNYVKDAQRDAKMTDLMLSDSDWTTDLYSNYFWYNGKIAKTGFPRNDILISGSSKSVDKVFNEYKIKSNKRIVLYAPTFRDGDKSLDTFEFNFKSIINKLDQKFSNEYVLLIRLHPIISKLLEINSDFSGNFGIKYIDASGYPDMQELILACDVLITDYSSCMFDAMLARKAVFLLAKDYKKYSTTDRKLLFNLKQDLPFSFSENEADMISAIDDFDTIQYQEKIKKFENSMNLLEDGKASDRVAEVLINQMEE